MDASSLLERRRRRFNNSLGLRSLVPKKEANSDAMEVLSDATTTASSTSASPFASPGATPKIVPCSSCIKEAAPAVPLRLRRNAFRNRPSINCELVLKDQQALFDPFADSERSRLKQQYEGFEKLGEGSCGVVYKVRDRAENKDVALKVMRMDDEERLMIAQKEYELLQHVTHPNIIRALDFFTYSMGAVLVLDYFEGKKLSSIVREVPNGRLQESSACRLSAQLIEAVAHLHSCGVIHRDIKADNILISNDLADLRLVDFNAAKRLIESQSLTMTGTVDYMPPEVLQGESPSEAGDVWAVGLCLHLMLDGCLPSERRALRIKFDSLSEVPLHQGSLVRLEGGAWETISEQCKEVVRETLKVDSDSRPTALSTLGMPWYEKESALTPEL